MDSYDKKSQNNLKQMDLWANFLKLHCKITNPFYVSEDKRFLRRPNITGGEFIQLFDKLCPARRMDETYQDYIHRKQISQINILADNDDSCNVHSNLPNSTLRLFENNFQNKLAKDTIFYLFSKFYELIIRIKCYKHGETSLNVLKSDLIEWVKIYDNFLNPKVTQLDSVKLTKLVEFCQSSQENNIRIKTILSDNQYSQLMKINHKNNNKNLNIIQSFNNSLQANQKRKLYYQVENYFPVTPYIHTFVFHVPEFLENFQDVNIFNIQGLEKLNDFTTQNFHLSTNRNLSNMNYLKQLINKQNRIDFYQLNLKMEDITKKKDFIERYVV